MSRWQNVTFAEMYRFLAITVLTGLVHKNRIRDYWSTDPLPSTPVFGSISNEIGIKTSQVNKRRAK